MSNGGYKGASPARETSPEQYPGVWELTEQFQAQAVGNWPFQADDCAPKSLRFNGSNSFLTRTPLADGNKTTWTWSAWVKRGSLGSFQYLFDCGSGSSPEEAPIRFWTDDRLNISAHTNTNIYNLTTTAKFRDTSAWMSIVVSFNSNEAVANDRIKLYINGKQVTEFDARNNPALGTGYYINDNIRHDIGRGGTSNYRFFSGLMSEVHFIDGQALSCDEFGFFDGQGIWQPKRFTGDYSSGPVYSNFLTSSGSFATSSEGPDKAFDGIATDASRAKGSADNILTFDISSFGFTGLFELWSQNTGAEFSIDGGSNWSAVGDDVWTTVSSDISGVSTIKMRPASGATMKVSAFKSQGQLLTDASAGRNSFSLDFADSSSTAALGYDSSGLGNNWTPNNLTAFAQAGNTSQTWSSNNHNYHSGAGSAFDGNLTTSSFASGGANANAYVDFTAINASKVEVYISAYGSASAGGYYYCRQTDTTQHTYTISSSGTSLGWITVYDGSQIAINRLGGARNSSGSAGSAQYAWRVDGVLLVDSGTAGFNASDIDSLIDSPVNGNESSTGAGGERRGNYCSFNPLDKHGSITLSEGNLKVQASTAQWELARSTFFLSSGKHYWEFTWTGSVTSSSGYQMGLKTPESTLSAAAQQAGSYAFQYTSIYQTAGSLNTFTVSPGSTTTGDTVMFAYDADAGKMWIGVNGTWNGSGNPATGANPDWTNLPTTGLSPFAGCYGSANTITLNAGQRAFKYTNHSGFSPLATSFLPEPTIKRGDEGLDVKTWSGNNAVSRQIKTSLSPDLAWIKVRNAANTWHHVTDILRGAPNKLYPNDSQHIEDTAPVYGQVDSLDTDGFTVGDGTHASNPLADVNQTGVNYVSFCWDAGEATTTVAAGSLTTSAFNTSQHWSANHASGNSVPTPAFDGTGPKQNGYAHSSGSLTLTFSPALSGRFIVYGGSGGGGADDYTISDGTTSTTLSSNQSYNSAPYFEVLDFGEQTGITTLTCSAGYTLYGVRVAGKLLVDSNVTPPNAPTIATTVRARPETGFSLITYSGNSTFNASVAHSLQAEPHFIITRNRSTASPSSDPLASGGRWYVYHKDLAPSQVVWTHSASGQLITSSNAYQRPTSLLHFKGSFVDINETGDNYVSYLWTSIDGYSKFTSFSGSGGDRFVYLGFKPRLIWFKNDDATANWLCYDTVRNPSNPANFSLQLDEPNTDTTVTNDEIDILSNGFNIKATRSDLTGSGNKILIAAWAEHPFASQARAR